MAHMFELIPPEEAKHMEVGQEIDLTANKDGGIRKKLIKKGSGDEYPNAGDFVRLRYTAYYGDEIAPEYLFDSSETDGKDFVYEVCRGKVVRGFELALMTMKPNEQAEIYLKPEYAYGRAGSPPKVPRDTPVIFVTELLEITCPDLSPEKDKTILKKVIVRGKGFSQPNEGCMVSIHIKGMCGENVFLDRDVTFPFGEGPSKEYGIPRFIEELLDQWKIGETSKLNIKSKHAYGKAGNAELGIPPEADLTYIIEMKNFERVKDIWEMDNIEKMDQCDMYKEKGTLYYKRGEFEMAQKFYHKMVDYVENDLCMKGDEETRRRKIIVAGNLNLALVHMKQEHYVEARKCCDKVIEVDESNVKALFRRGKSYFQTKYFEEAKADFEKVLKVEPRNKEVINEHRQCLHQIKQSKEKEKTLYRNMMSGVGKFPVGEKPCGNAMENINMWSNEMANGMMTLDEERQAFGEVMPDKGDNNHGGED